MKKLSTSDFLQVSVMLFGMFFGAGNLIFPPLLGNQAGSALWPALLSFSITAVLFPVLGSIAVGKTEGLSNLANRVGYKFSIIFTVIAFVSIGPGIGIPRAGSVPFEMAIAPYLPESFNLLTARLLYTFVFFALALMISLKPSKLVKRVGKYLTPFLLVLIVFMFFRLLSLPANVTGPVGEYKTNPMAVGFLKGYETLDAVAALNFGLVISLAISRLGVTDKGQVTKYTAKAGLVAGALLFSVYAMLSYLGVRSSANLVGAENGAVILSHAVELALGNFGVALLAAIFTLACLTTCIGLITSGGEYFFKLFKEKISYRTWVTIWTLISFVFANFGLNNLLTYSVPLLLLIYPVSLFLIVVGVSHDLVSYPRLAYQVGALISVVLPLINLLASYGVNLPVLTAFEQGLMFSDVGLSWMLPTALGVLLATLFAKVFAKQGASAREDLV
ncbi:MAG: branched-chain amino acid transport system II carrier protein [Bacillota bacterium]|nr:branched-chain amino acid transport system II carrier protein [Bacillota bacterium]